MTKTINLIFFIFYFLLLFSCFNQFGMTGPEKPIISNELTDIWKTKFEKKYNCKIDYLGLDDGFQEDSIIYLNLEFGSNSLIKNELLNDWRKISKKIAKSFYIKTNNDKIHYLRIYYDGKGFTKSVMFDNHYQNLYEINN